VLTSLLAVLLVAFVAFVDKFRIIKVRQSDSKGVIVNNLYYLLYHYSLIVLTEPPPRLVRLYSNSSMAIIVNVNVVHLRVIGQVVFETI